MSRNKGKELTPKKEPQLLEFQEQGRPKNSKDTKNEREKHLPTNRC